MPSAISLPGPSSRLYAVYPPKVTDVKVLGYILDGIIFPILFSYPIRSGVFLRFQTSDYQGTDIWFTPCHLPVYSVISRWSCQLRSRAQSSGSFPTIPIRLLVAFSLEPS